MDVMYMTDHDFRALAYYHVKDLSGLTLERVTSGSLSQGVASTNTLGFRLLAESSGSAPGSMGLRLKPSTVLNRLRTSIGGQSLTHRFGDVALADGAIYEVVVDLSHHPYTGGRQAGAYQLRYRFGVAPGMTLEAGGLVGLMGRPAPRSGEVATLNLESDVSQLWPDMVAFDNCFYNLTFLATSPHFGSVADVTVSSVTFSRTQNTEAAVIANQRTLVDTYRADYPYLDVYPSEEISRLDPHVNVFGAPQFFPRQRDITASTRDAYYRQMILDAHSKGGLASYNHPFGASGGPLASPTSQATARRQVFQQMRAVDAYGTDILEVGYNVRGKVNCQTHVDLWDTFSRDGRFYTGTGVNDDHNGGAKTAWSGLNNGYATGIWASSRAQADLMEALSGGRVYCFHVGGWPGGQIDMLADTLVPMGSASISDQSTRSLTIYATGIPTGGVVRLVAGQVDYKGAVDPGTVVLDTISAAAFESSAGAVSTSLDISVSTFVRAQVHNSNGAIIGIGNPIWLLREQPPNGIPPSRLG
jgi:hypothetical protein